MVGLGVLSPQVSGGQKAESGGGSALFGANAVGGTINIITKDPINN